jgi:ankyrin repeat protein
VTALHLAAQSGRRNAVEALIDLGADPTVWDTPYDSPPSGWADHSGHRSLAELLQGAETR